MSRCSLEVEMHWLLTIGHVAAIAFGCLIGLVMLPYVICGIAAVFHK
jgi:hypothetical protein